MVVLFIDHVYHGQSSHSKRLILIMVHATADLRVYQPLKEKVPVFHPPKKVIVIAGPTASGKTDLSLEIASLVHGEIISADSMQVYEGMDIGTAKVTQEERGKIPHHLIDVCKIHEPFNVVQYFNLASEALSDIVSRGNVPIVVGGTGYYIHSLLYGAPSTPPSDKKTREHLQEQLDRLGVDALYNKLKRIDPLYAAKISPRDTHKIMRGLEVYVISQRSISSYSVNKRLNNQYNWRPWFIYYPREILYNRTDLRCEQMVDSGLIEEVRRLEKEGLMQNNSAATSIGYKQCLEFLHSDQSKSDFIYEFQKATRHYVKRQFTWFKRDKMFHWIDLHKNPRKYVVELILHDFEQSL